MARSLSLFIHSYVPIREVARSAERDNAADEHTVNIVAVTLKTILLLIVLSISSFIKRALQIWTDTTESIFAQI